MSNWQRYEVIVSRVFVCLLVCLFLFKCLHCYLSLTLLPLLR